MKREKRRIRKRNLPNTMSEDRIQPVWRGKNHRPSSWRSFIIASKKRTSICWMVALHVFLFHVTIETQCDRPSSSSKTSSSLWWSFPSSPSLSCSSSSQFFFGFAYGSEIETNDEETDVEPNTSGNYSTTVDNTSACTVDGSEEGLNEDETDTGSHENMDDPNDTDDVHMNADRQDQQNEQRDDEVAIDHEEIIDGNHEDVGADDEEIIDGDHEEVGADDEEISEGNHIDLVVPHKSPEQQLQQEQQQEDNDTDQDSDVPVDGESHHTTEYREQETTMEESDLRVSMEDEASAETSNSSPNDVDGSDANIDIDVESDSRIIHDTTSMSDNDGDERLEMDDNGHRSESNSVDREVTDSHVRHPGQHTEPDDYETSDESNMNDHVGVISNDETMNDVPTDGEEQIEAELYEESGEETSDNDIGDSKSERFEEGDVDVDVEEQEKDALQPTSAPEDVHVEGESESLESMDEKSMEGSNTTEPIDESINGVIGRNDEAEQIGTENDTARSEEGTSETELNDEQETQVEEEEVEPPASNTTTQESQSGSLASFFENAKKKQDSHASGNGGSPSRGGFEDMQRQKVQQDEFQRLYAKGYGQEYPLEDGDLTVGTHRPSASSAAAVAPSATSSATASDADTRNDSGNGKVKSDDDGGINSNEHTYSGEPWGLFRSRRRLPDLQLLYLVFQDTLVGGWEQRRKAFDDEAETARQSLLDWLQGDPRYDRAVVEQVMNQSEDEDSAKCQEEGGCRDIHHHDKEEILSTTTPSSSGSMDSTLLNGENDENVDLDADFVEGLDDINKFFEPVDPQYVDVGASGFSMQEVIMGQGRRIIVKKVQQAVSITRNAVTTFRRRAIRQWKKLRSGQDNDSEEQSQERPDERKDDTSDVNNDDDDRHVLLETVSKQWATVRQKTLNVWNNKDDIVERVVDWFDDLYNSITGLIKSDEEDEDYLSTFQKLDLSNLPPNPEAKTV